MAIRRRVPGIDGGNLGMTGPVRQGPDREPAHPGPQPWPSPEGPDGPHGIPVPPGGGSDSAPGMSSEGPREAEAVRRRPMEPTPMAGGVMPSPPLPSASPGMMARAGGGLFGGQRGLTGGGLGVPMDPTSNAKSDPITTLLSMLKGMKL